jgi:hypothetical protein
MWFYFLVSCHKETVMMAISRKLLRLLWLPGILACLGLRAALPAVAQCSLGFSPLGTGSDSSVWALTVFDDGSGPSLYSGGRFTAGGASALVGRWDGSSWSVLPGLQQGPVWGLAVYDDGTGVALYAVAGGCVSKWDGDTWICVGEGINLVGRAKVLETLDLRNGSGPMLYAGTTLPFGHPGVNRWDPAAQAWTELGEVGNAPGWVVAPFALEVFDDGRGTALYAGGQFGTIDGVTVNGIARWDGVTWSPLVMNGNIGLGGVWPFVFALKVFDDGRGPALYVGGSFASAGGLPIAGVARWDGAAWSALGANTAIGVWGLEQFDDGRGPALYATGGFTQFGGIEANGIARWDGQSWTTLRSGLFRDSAMLGMALNVFDDGSGPALFVGGRFDTAGGRSVNNIAKWACLPGDLNNDGCVDLADLGILLADFGCTGGNCPGDVDGDGDTDLTDLGILLANWGSCGG